VPEEDELEELELEDDDELDELLEDELELDDEELDEDDELELLEELELDDELELELEDDDVEPPLGCEHSLVPPATWVPTPKVDSPQTKLPLSTLKVN